MSQCLVVPNIDNALDNAELRFTFRVTGKPWHNFDFTPDFAQSDTNMRAAFLVALQAAVLAKDGVVIAPEDCIMVGLPTSLLPDEGLGGGGSVSVVENKTFLADATSYTFSGLDGDSVLGYELTFDIINGHATDPTFFTLKPNNLATDQQQRQWATNGSPNTATWSVLYFAGGVAQNTLSSGRCFIHTQTGKNRIFEGRYGGTMSATWAFIEHFGEWANTADNITSLVVLSDQTDGLKAGSNICLRAHSLA